jgi:glycosyltransferase involved in cell wall biosynthesis
MKIAVFSPLNPTKSGISDFTEEVVLRLKDYIDIDLFVDGYKPTNPKIISGFDIYNFEDIECIEIRRKYDHILYHVGNHAPNHGRIVEYSLKYPGIVELHDFDLQHLLAAMMIPDRFLITYLLIMMYCHGERGEAVTRLFLTTWAKKPWEQPAFEYPVNKHILERATGIIVHSDFVKQLIKGMKINKPIKKISLHTYEIVDDYINHSINCKKKLNIDPGKVMLASFGFASPGKRIAQILDALALLKEEFDDFVYYIVGELHIPDFEERVRELDLTEHVSVTGYVGLDEFFDYLGAADICFNLRYPTQGESSASLHRALGMGKPVFVTKIGSFEEYPDDTVIKIDADENEAQSICNELSGLLKSEKEMAKRRKNALKYAKENCSLENNCAMYADFFEQLSRGTFSEDDSVDLFLDKIEELDKDSENLAEQVEALVEEVGLIIA